MYVYMYVCMCVCVYIYIYIYMMYVCIHAYNHGPAMPRTQSVGDMAPDLDFVPDMMY